MIESCAAIVIAAKHHELIKVKDTRGTTHTVGALRCRFDFRTTDWDYSVKTAMFCNGDAILHPEVADKAIAVPLDEDNECAVPYEVLTDTLPYSIGVWGVTADGLRIVSSWLVFNAQPGCYTKGNAPSDPEPTIYEQILITAQSAKDMASDVVDRANNGEFNGQTPYVGENGNWWTGEVDSGIRADGKSAYEIAKNLGYAGTEAEWIESLQGEDGVGIAEINFNDNGEMLVVMTDGVIQNVGKLPIDLDAHIAEADKKYETKVDASAKLKEAKDYADAEIAKDRTRLDALEAIDHEQILADAKAYTDELVDGLADIDKNEIAMLLECLTWGEFNDIADEFRLDVTENELGGQEANIVGVNITLLNEENEFGGQTAIIN